MKLYPTFIFFLLAFTFSCASKKKTILTPVKSIAGIQRSKPTLIYKTKSDYYYNVPVELDETKSAVVSYPAPSDLIKTDTGFVYPTRLNHGYLLDNRGVSKNTAFLELTYREYASLPEVSPEFLFKKIKDKEPFICLYYAGPRNGYTNLIEQLNSTIDKKDFSNFEKLY